MFLPSAFTFIDPGAQPFDIIRLEDGSELTWQQIVDRGVVTLPTATEYVHYIKIRSELLSKFYGRPIFLRRSIASSRSRRTS